LDSLTFIVELTKALAWPITFVVVALLFRKQLISLLGALKKGKVGPAEFEFEREVRQIESAAADLPSAPTSSEVAREAASNPRGAVLEAWLKLEDQAIDLALSRGLTNATARRYALGAINGIRKSGLLKDEYLRVLEELQELRNRAAHDPDFTSSPDAVLSYVRLAADLGQELERLTPT
jgi:hypothetical protein